METIPRGTRVLISRAHDYHNGDSGIVTSDVQQSASCVQIGSCTHVYHNSELQPLPEPDTIPAPIEV